VVEAAKSLRHNNQPEGMLALLTGVADHWPSVVDRCRCALLLGGWVGLGLIGLVRVWVELGFKVGGGGVWWGGGWEGWGCNLRLA